MKVFRFDDVCINSENANHADIVMYLVNNLPKAQIILAVSPLTFNGCGERVYPKILNACSDYRKFYLPDRLGFPETYLGLVNQGSVKLASHGLVHCDHRLMQKSAQELSILTSCSLIGTKIFVPPFNKWNTDTEAICNEHGIELIKWEDGWLCAEYNKFNPEHNLWYLHAREFTIETFTKWIQSK